MGRSTGTWFVIALVMGTVAFIATLMLTPLPGDEPLSKEELAQREERQRVRQIVGAYNAERVQLITEQDWVLVADRASGVLEVSPTYHWAHLDLLYAMSQTDADEAAFARRLADLDAILKANPRPGQARLQASAARGWHDWFAGDEESARGAWLEAAALATVGASDYVEAGYRSLAGEDDAAIEAWEQALRAGWAIPSSWSPDPIGYARADYDNMFLIKDPRFEAAIVAWRTEQEARAAENAQAALDAMTDEPEAPVAADETDAVGVGLPAPGDSDDTGP